MQVRFEAIPAISRFAVFDKGGSDDPLTWEVPEGDWELVCEMPVAWVNPYWVLHCRDYYLPVGRGRIGDPGVELMFSGGDDYLDVSLDLSPEERNRNSVELLIHKLLGSDDLDGRQKFYVALVSLQSHLEFLTHGMLVLSEHLTEVEYRKLWAAKARIDAAFSDENTSFFSTEIEIASTPERDHYATSKQHYYAEAVWYLCGT